MNPKRRLKDAVRALMHRTNPAITNDEWQKLVVDVRLGVNPFPAAKKILEDRATSTRTIDAREIITILRDQEHATSADWIILVQSKDGQVAVTWWSNTEAVYPMTARDRAELCLAEAYAARVNAALSKGNQTSKLEVVFENYQKEQRRYERDFGKIPSWIEKPLSNLLDWCKAIRERYKRLEGDKPAGLEEIGRLASRKGLGCEDGGTLELTLDHVIDALNQSAIEPESPAPEEKQIPKSSAGKKTTGEKTTRESPQAKTSRGRNKRRGNK